MDKDFIAAYWYAYIYEQQERQTHDVDFLLDLLKRETHGAPQRILEVACGGGRICVPLAQAGHDVTGFDASEAMLLRCYRRMAGFPNLRCYRADATQDGWGSDFDVVVLAGNILMNIESALEYAEAQAMFIEKAGRALRRGGHLFLDFDLHADPQAVFHKPGDGACYFEGSDDLGTYGRTASYGSVYDPVTQICSGVSHVEIITNNGEARIIPERWYKHIPTLHQVYGWLADAGLTPEKTFANYSDTPLTEPLDENTYRATLWVRKA